jgi:hypothetical protein
MEADVLNISPFVVWVIALSQLLTFGLTVWNLMASGSRANAKALDAHKTMLDHHGLRLSSIEQAIADSPGRKDMHELHIALSEMRGDLKEMRATMKGNNEVMRRLETIVSRHEDHLLDGAKR